jgi:hypothetical protein
VEVGEGERSDLLVGRGVQQGEQASEALVGLGGGVGPPFEEGALCGAVQDGAGEGGLRAEGERFGGVDEDQSAGFGPGEEAAQHICPLVAGRGCQREERLEVGGGHFGPAGQPAGRGQAIGEIAQDAQLGLDGLVALWAGADAAGAAGRAGAVGAPRPAAGPGRSAGQGRGW